MSEWITRRRGDTYNSATRGNYAAFQSMPPLPPPPNTRAISMAGNASVITLGSSSSSILYSTYSSTSDSTVWSLHVTVSRTISSANIVSIILPVVRQHQVPPWGTASLHGTNSHGAFSESEFHIKIQWWGFEDSTSPTWTHLGTASPVFRCTAVLIPETICDSILTKTQSRCGTNISTPKRPLRQHVLRLTLELHACQSEGRVFPPGS
jgi:hypothetical protein